MQQHFNNSQTHSSRCRNCIFILAFLWTASIILGAVFAANAGEKLAPVVFASVHHSVSLAGLVIILLLPLAVSAICIYSRCYTPIFLICCCKGLVVGYCLYAVLLVFETAGWIIWPMLTFADSTMLVPLFWFWLRSLKRNSLVFADLIVCLICAAVIGCLDYYIISPYLIEITNLL